MASYLTANMSLVIPVPGSEPGPTWATDLNTSLGIVDSHTHAPGSGVQITPAGLNINADLSFQSTNNAINLRSVRFTSQGSPLALATDIGCLYESGNDLYYNDGAGTQIRITQSGAVAGSSGTITGLPSGTASAAFTPVNGTFVFQQATSTAANFDVGSIAIRYPGSYPTPAGNYIQLQAPAALSSGYNITLPALPGANDNFLTMSTTGVISSAVAVDNSTLEIAANVLQVADGGITLAKQAAPNIIQATSSSYTNSSLAYTDVTGMSVTITTTGRPVMIMGYALVPAGITTGLSVNRFSGTGAASAQLQLLRGATVIGIHGISVTVGANAPNMLIPPGSLVWFDTPAAGTYTYKVQGINGTGTILSVTDAVGLSAYEF